jgi:hypothetical protein
MEAEMLCLGPNELPLYAIYKLASNYKRPILLCVFSQFITGEHISSSEEEELSLRLPALTMTA